ncbi:hypothetical protein K458DRAFT_392600 [Lentithecium fluviatile CBS 122367]|uniref:Uncharacterized protein n=1 Tax=Lentithecium fluviatile CBS 122367 TaxID=1168545 RepID=A0A6G1ISI5_9PLEO|nr:hypothetical protein K458DRAFT_392600 [Lentithecium fluviatile CBS 122367]
MLIIRVVVGIIFRKAASTLGFLCGKFEVFFYSLVFRVTHQIPVFIGSITKCIVLVNGKPANNHKVRTGSRVPHYLIVQLDLAILGWFPKWFLRPILTRRCNFWLILDRNALTQRYQWIDEALRSIGFLRLFLQDLQLLLAVHWRTTDATPQTLNDRLQQEEEFGRVWFQKTVDVTRRWIDAENACNEEDQKWKALMVKKNLYAFVDPTFVSGSLDMLRELGKNLEPEIIGGIFSERKQKHIEDLIDEGKAAFTEEKRGRVGSKDRQ